jgi:hypothetical protein
MTKKTKNTLIIAGVVLASIIVINKVRASNKMVTDESSGLFGLGILGIL